LLVSKNNNFNARKKIVPWAVLPPAHRATLIETTVAVSDDPIA